ncbi:MAG: PHP domain-containing protein, partial [Planctomycetota bacterium]
MSDFGINLHIHTRFSDGRFTPYEVVSHCADAAMEIIAITDHCFL